MKHIKDRGETEDFFVIGEKHSKGAFNALLICMELKPLNYFDPSTIQISLLIIPG